MLSAREYEFMMGLPAENRSAFRVLAGDVLPPDEARQGILRLLELIGQLGSNPRTAYQAAKEQGHLLAISAIRRHWRGLLTC